MMQPLEVTPALLARRFRLRDPPDDADKEARGRALVFAGAPDVPGAALLSGEAALRAGAGKLTIAAPAPLAHAIGVAFPEARVVGLGGRFARTAGRLFDEAHAVLVGPGMAAGLARSTAALALRHETRAPLILDAAALHGLWDVAASVSRRARRAPVVLTPHAGEMAKLGGRSKASILADPLDSARTAAAHLGAIVVLKGATTIVATPAGEAFRHVEAVPGLATAGSGDVLAGLIAGLAARCEDALAASLWGVFLHAQAGLRLGVRCGKTGYLAREIACEAAKTLDERLHPLRRPAGRKLLRKRGPVRGRP